MTYAPRPYLKGEVGPLGSIVILRHAGRQLEQLASGLEQSAEANNRAAAGQLRVALSTMQESARQWRTRAESEGSEDGTSEPADPVGGASSAADGGAVHGLTVREVAERLRVSPEMVRRLCRSQDGRGLSATKHCGQWVIDAASVDTYEATRRPAA